MKVLVIFVLYFLHSGSVQCSSIITRNMIRMPRNVSVDSGIQRVSTESSFESSKLDDNGYQIVYPVYRENSVGKYNALRNGSNHTSQIVPSSSEENPPISNNQSLSETSKVNFGERSIGTTHNFSLSTQNSSSQNTNHRSSPVELLEKSTKSELAINTPSEISQKYWSGYQNFSNEFFKGNGLFEEDIGVARSNMLDVIHHFINCVWATSFMSCLQQHFSGSAASHVLPYFQLFIPPTQPYIEDEYNPGRNDKFDIDNADQDEGRKRLSKKLLSLVPLLLMIKMTMIPALVVMAVISGKAFLISLLSLGMALLSATLPGTSSLTANKRHEVAPQALPQDSLASNYYYVM